MKKAVPSAGTRNNRHPRRPRHVRGRGERAVTEMLKLCLEKVCELQADLERTTEVHDPEAAGYAACALEALRFLNAQGLAPDHPLVTTLTEKLLQDGQRERD